MIQAEGILIGLRELPTLAREVVESIVWRPSVETMGMPAEKNTNQPLS